MRQFSVLVTFLKSTHNSKSVEFRSSGCIKVARGPKFVTAARNFKITRPAAKFSARKKPATKLFGPHIYFWPTL